MKGSKKRLTKKQSKAKKQTTLVNQANQEKLDPVMITERFDDLLKSAKDIIPAFGDDDERVVASSEAKSVVFPTVFTMKPDAHVIRCGKCCGDDLVVLIRVSLGTLKPRIYRSCGPCCGAPKYRMELMQPDVFNRLLEITSLLNRELTPDEIADEFASLFEKLGERIKRRTCKYHANVCFHCKELNPSNSCSGCFLARFCNDECNNAGWKKHKEDCERQREVLGKHRFVNFK